MTIAALFITLFLGILIGMPVAIALGFSSVVTILFFSDDSIASIALKMYEATSEHYTLLAIPFFILSSPSLNAFLRATTGLPLFIAIGLSKARAQPHKGINNNSLFRRVVIGKKKY